MQFYRNAAPRWSREARRTSALRVLISPYITSTVAHTLASGGSAAIYTLFDAELFARGASSIAALERLLKSGHQLYAVPELHAKVMLVGDSFATVGSQNLTRRGQRSKEATAAFVDATHIERIRAVVQPWIDDAEPISMFMIQRMKSRLPALRTIFKKARGAADDVTQNVLAEEQARLRQSNSTSARKRRQARTIAGIRNSLSRALRPAQAIWAQVHPRRSGRATLKPASRRHFTYWDVDGQELELLWGYRYLCLMDQRGVFGWGRIVDSRISFFENSMVDEIDLDGRTFKVEVEADWGEDREYGRNVSVRIKTWYGLDLCDVSGSFEVERFQTWHIECLASIESATGLRDWIQSHPDEFAAALLPNMLRPFRYKHALTGTDPAKFVGEVGTRVRVEAVKVGEYPVLVFQH